MKKLRRFCLGSLAALTVLSMNGCGGDAPPPPKAEAPKPIEQLVEEGLNDSVLLRVNAKPVTQYDFNLWQLSTGKRDLTPALEQELLDRITEAELVYQKGLELGLDKEPGFQRTMALAAAKIKFIRLQEMEEMVNRHEAGKVTISEEEAMRYYKANEGQIRAKYHFGSLQFPNEKEAKEAVAKIRKGMSFESVAESVVRALPGVDPDQDTRRFWDTGFVTWSQIPPNVMAVVANMKTGAVSDPIPFGNAGYVVLKLMEKGKHAEADFTAVRDEIVGRLKEQTVTKNLKNLREQLKTQARIEKVSSPAAVNMAAAPALH